MHIVFWPPKETAKAIREKHRASKKHKQQHMCPWQSHIRSTRGFYVRYLSCLHFHTVAKTTSSREAAGGGRCTSAHDIQSRDQAKRVSAPKHHNTGAGNGICASSCHHETMNYEPFQKMNSYIFGGELLTNYKITDWPEMTIKFCSVFSVSFNKDALN